MPQRTFLSFFHSFSLFVSLLIFFSSIDFLLAIWLPVVVSGVQRMSKCLPFMSYKLSWNSIGFQSHFPCISLSFPLILTHKTSQFISFFLSLSTSDMLSKKNSNNEKKWWKWCNRLKYLYCTNNTRNSGSIWFCTCH